MLLSLRLSSESIACQLGALSYAFLSWPQYSSFSKTFVDLQHHLHFCACGTFSLYHIVCEFQNLVPTHTQRLMLRKTQKRGEVVHTARETIIRNLQTSHFPTIKRARETGQQNIFQRHSMQQAGSNNNRFTRFNICSNLVHHTLKSEVCIPSGKHGENNVASTKHPVQTSSSPAVPLSI